MELIRKVYAATVVEKAAGKPLVALVSTPDVDLVGDVIVPMPNDKGNGWNVEQFNRRGGRINWMHDAWFRPNLAKARAVPSDDGLLLEVEFDLKDEFAALLDRKYRDGFLDEWSVGFMGVKGKAEANQAGGMTFYEAELIEVSAVNAGMNPETQTLVKSFAEMGDRLRSLEAVVIAGEDKSKSAEQARELLEDLKRLRAAVTASSGVMR